MKHLIKHIVTTPTENGEANDFFFEDGFIVNLVPYDQIFLVQLCIDRRNPAVNQDPRLPERFRLNFRNESVLAWSQPPEVSVGWITYISRIVVSIDWVDRQGNGTKEIGERLRREYFPSYC